MCFVLDKGICILIIVLILICVVLVAAGTGIYKLKRKIREVSREAFGTDNFIEGYKKTTEELAITPRSVNGMTRVLLPSINRDFSEFNVTDAKTKSEVFIKAYLNALESKHTDSLNIEGISRSVRDKADEIIQDLESNGQRVFYDNIVIHQTEISNYTKKDGMCTVNFQSSVEYLNYLLDKDDNVISGSREMKRQTVFETDYTYIQDINKLKESGNYSSISLSCPHCGAPITNLGAKFCEYCGSGVKEINIYSWNFTDIREIDKNSKKFF